MTFCAPVGASMLLSRFLSPRATCLSSIRREVRSVAMASVAATAPSKVQFVELMGQGLAQRKAAIQDLRVVPLEGPSRYIRPQSIRYKQHGKDRRWDMVQSHPSVAVLLFHTGAHHGASVPPHSARSSGSGNRGGHKGGRGGRAVNRGP
ncbi:hypothetical protein CLOP_g23925 [Closterium sp. NIES-67]|nr:hypothetical protein CLOP_g23925 [Closterium sp. NIES-67]